MGRCAERDQCIREPQVNKSPPAKASGMPAPRNTRPLPWCSLSVSGGCGWEGQERSAAKTRRRQRAAGASSKGTSLQPQLQGVAVMNQRLSEKRRGRRGEREGRGSRGGSRALMTRTRNPFFFLTKAALCSPDHRPLGWGGQHGGREQERGQEDGKAAVHPPGVRQQEADAAGAPTHPTPTAQPPAQVRRWPPQPPLVAPARPGGGRGDSPQRLEVPFLEQG